MTDWLIDLLLHEFPISSFDISPYISSKSDYTNEYGRFHSKEHHCSRVWSCSAAPCAGLRLGLSADRQLGHITALKLYLCFLGFTSQVHCRWVTFRIAKKKKETLKGTCVSLFFEVNKNHYEILKRGREHGVEGEGKWRKTPSLV